MSYRFEVGINLRDGIADPEGATIERALAALGFDGVRGVRVGKVLHLDLDAADAEAAEAAVAAMCDRLLANPVIERYEARLVR